jgi:monoamine oxidase
MRDVDTIVVGAGVAGLLTAVRLAVAGHDVQVFEARDRIGGRCLSMDKRLPVDLGASWHWSEHERVPPLLEELGLERFRQHEPGIAIYEPRRDRPVQHVEWPETPPPSWRIRDGTQAIAQALSEQLSDGSVRLGHRVTRIQKKGNGISATANQPNGEPVTITAECLVCAVPPRLAAHAVAFEPELPSDLNASLRRTPTWMSHSLKAGVVYDRPFWRENGLAGRVRSFAGPVGDWHDASPPDALEKGAAGGLFGFGVPQAFQGRSEEENRAAIIEQLVHCFGDEASEPLAVRWLDWSRDLATTPESGSACRGEHPRAASRLAEPLWDGRLSFAAAETAQEHPGFLDGAIESAERAAQHVVNLHQRA